MTSHTLRMYMPDWLRTIFSASAWRTLLVLSIPILQACSDSATDDNINDPPLVFPVTAPFVFDGALYEYRKDLQQANKLVEFGSGAATFLDTDVSKEISDYLEQNFLFSDATPDHFAFQSENSVKLFQFETKRVHNIYDFASDDNPNGQEQLCALRPVTRFDEEPFNAETLILKEEPSVYARAVAVGEDCNDMSASRYYKLLITESSELFAITQEVEREISGQIEKVTVRVSFPVLTGAKRIASEALMNAAAPIKSTDRFSDEFGYLGYDSEGSLQLYVANNESFEEIDRLWSLEHPDFSLQATENFNREQIVSPFPSEYRNPSLDISNDKVYLGAGWSLSSFTLNSIFDVADQAERNTQLNNTLVSRSMPLPAEFSSFDLRTTQTNIRFFNDTSLVDIDTSLDNVNHTTVGAADIEGLELGLANQLPVILKTFDNDDSSFVTVQTSIEQTLRIRSDDQTRLLFNEEDQYSVLNTEDGMNGSWQGTVYQFATVTTAQNDLLFVNIIDERSYFGHDEGPTDRVAVLYAENQNNPSTVSALSNPSLFSALTSEFPPLGDKIASLNALVTDSPENKVRILSDDYGYAQLAVVNENNEVELALFYFDPVDTIEEPGLPPVMERITIPSGD